MNHDVSAGIAFNRTRETAVAEPFLPQAITFDWAGEGLPTEIHMVEWAFFQLLVNGRAGPLRAALRVARCAVIGRRYTVLHPIGRIAAIRRWELAGGKLGLHLRGSFGSLGGRHRERSSQVPPCTVTVHRAIPWTCPVAMSPGRRSGNVADLHTLSSTVRESARPVQRRRPSRCSTSGEIMRKTAIMTAVAASFLVSPLAVVAQETQPTAPTEEPAPAPEPADAPAPTPAPEPTDKPAPTDAPAPTEEPAPAPQA